MSAGNLGGGAKYLFSGPKCPPRFLVAALLELCSKLSFAG